jgi:hypothetical protein
MIWKSLSLRLVLVIATVLGLALLLSLRASTAPAEARARPITVEEKEPFDTILFGPYPCIQENIQLQGTIHLVFHVVFGPNDTVRLSMQQIALNGTGTGLTTGAQYRVSDASHSTFTAGPTQFEYTITGHQRFIGQGRTPDFFLHFVGHTTVNAKGQVTSDFYNFRITCRPESPYPPPGTPTAEPYPPPGTLTPTAEPYPPPGTLTPTAEPYPPPSTLTPTAEPYPPPGTLTPTAEPYPPPPYPPPSTPARHPTHTPRPRHP